MSNLMPMNEHAVERGVRVALGLGLLAPLGVVGLSVWTAIAAAVGLILVVTGAVGTCPIYTMLGLSTRGGESKPKTS